MFGGKVVEKCWTILTTKIYPTVPVETSPLRSWSTWGTVFSNFDIITLQINGDLRIFANQTACQWNIPIFYTFSILVLMCTLLSKLVNSTKDQSEAERDRDNNLHDDAVALLHNEVKLYSIKYLNNLSNA